MLTRLMDRIGARRENNRLREDEFTVSPQKTGAIEAFLQAENDAVSAYGRCGLPMIRGEYCRKPGTVEWIWIADRLTPEEKWNLLEDQPISSGWAYCTFAELGRHDTDSALANLASEILVACIRLENEEHFQSRTIVETAIKLGIDWQKLIDADPGIRLLNPMIAAPEPYRP